MVRGLLLIYLLCLSALPASSGAWLRSPGSGFTSATATLRRSEGVWSRELGYYAEFGLTPWLTLGLDLNDNDNMAGHAVVFARLPLGRQSQRRRLAAEMALGGNHYRNTWRAMQKLTLSYGRAFDSTWGPGWLALDSTYELRNNGADPITKLDATIGLHSPNHWRPMLQLESAKLPGLPLFYAITPTVQMPLNRNTKLLIGVEHRSTTRRSLGLKIGLWHNF